MPLRPKFRAKLKDMEPDDAIAALIKVVRRLEEVILILFVAMALGAVAIYPVITGATARRAYVNDQIRNIWCTLVDRVPDDPLDPQIHQIRVLYRCGAFDIKNEPPRSRTSATPSPSKTRPSDRPGAIENPSPTQAPSPAVTSSGAGPVATRTVTRSSTATRTKPVPGPTTTKLGVPLPSPLLPLPSALCSLPVVGPLVC